MADVTGPISSMPGSLHKIPEGMMCDTSGHHLRPAYRRVQGETDSFGCELMDMCEECFKTYKEEVSKPVIGTCKWCKCSGVAITPHRDWEEGMAGPLYDICAPCIKKDLDALHHELNACRYPDDDDYDNDDSGIFDDDED